MKFNFASNALSGVTNIAQWAYAAIAAAERAPTINPMSPPRIASTIASAKN